LTPGRQAGGDAKLFLQKESIVLPVTSISPSILICEFFFLFHFYQSAHKTSLLLYESSVGTEKKIISGIPAAWREKRDLCLSQICTISI